MTGGVYVQTGKHQAKILPTIRRPKFKCVEMHSTANLMPWFKYIPAVASLHIHAQHDDSPQDELPEDFILLLPSQLNATTPCDLLLCQIEWRLRHAQAGDALNDVHQHICLHTHLNTFKTLHIRGQQASTHAHNALDLVEVKNLIVGSSMSLLVWHSIALGTG